MSTTGVASVETPADTPAPYRRRWAALFVILAAEVMDLLDAVVTNIAGPAMRADLGGGASTLQWLAAAYTLSMAVGLVTGGRLGDIHGRRRMFLVGAAGFTVGSLLCAISVSPAMLIAARVVQGLFGAVMLPQGLGMIKEMFPPKESQKAFGLFGPVMGLSAVCGPILAGWLVDADYFGTGWRMIFLINLPLGAAALLGALRYLPRTRSASKPRLDIPGMLLVSLGALLIIFPLVQGREYDWPGWTFAMMAASVLVFVAFGVYESRLSKAGRDPLVVPSLFRKRGFSGGMALGLVFFSTMQGFMLVFNLYAQIGLGYAPLKAGLLMVPWSGGMVVGFGVAQAVARFGRAVLQAGTLVMAAGVFGVWLTLDMVGDGVGPWQLVPSLLVTGIGMGLLMAPFFDIVLSSVEQHETGSASGTMTAMQQLGGAFGVALLGTVFFGLLGGGIADAVDHRSDGLRRELAAAHVAPAAREHIVTDLRACAADRAVAKDPEATPASCTRLDKDTRSALTSPRAGARIPAALEDTASSAFRGGFGSVMKSVLWIVDALLALTFLLAFLLPRHARPEGSAGH
ncbi:MFS transporter [Streptomyces sp. 5-8]|uniref:MFS transporter n=1 Tax=Streptomyces musisoli TaxID=2802280 RepID=A0ABS1P2U4_9ACTN|nr:MULTISPECIES: MFS transporter [Streptomyces]MBL1106509.1 MFS transporter [Streptomyces musisoli]MBY8840695.1 MFS transporter [Streptomyces sp. SP2-10]